MTIFNKEKELQYIKNFIKKEGTNFYYFMASWRQLQSLWTAYCVRHDLMPDTYEYDNEIEAMHTQIIQQLENKKMNTHGLRFKNYKDFDLYMGTNLC